MSTWFLRRLPVAVLLLPLVAAPSLVAAQEQAKPEETKPAETQPAQTPEEKAKIEQAEKEGVVRTGEEVTVTGSLIPRPDVEALSPVTVVEAQEVVYTGTGRVEDLVQSLPQVFAQQNSTISNGATGTATVDLRHLGPERTLTLVNGHRMAAGDAFEAGGDMNFIPAALVKRVDILTGGASSAYGADAVAGVVNFVLDTEFEGFRGAVSWNGFQHNNSNDLAQEINAARGYTAPSGSTFNHGGWNFNLAVGGKLGGGKGHASAFIDYRDIGDIWKDQRDYTNCSVQALGATGPACGGSATWQHGRFLAPGRGDFVLDPNTGNTNTFRPRLATDVFNFAPFNFMQRNDQKWGGGAFAHYTVSKHFEPYAEVMFMDDYSDAQIAPSGNFFNTTEINCDNPMMSAQQRQLVCGSQTSGTTSLFIGRRNVEGGNRTSQLTHVNWRAVAGIRGDIGSSAWSYDLHGLNSDVSSPQTYINDLSVSRMQEALDVVGDPGDPSTWRCRSGNPNCHPWNIFTLGAVTQEATDYIATPLVLDSGVNTKVLGLTLRGDLESAGLKLPSATEGLQLAVGGWVSKNSMFIHPDDTYINDPAAGQGGPTLPVDGHYNTKEFYSELRIPLVQDRSGLQDLSLELGYRFMNYQAQEQDAKNNSSYKAMLSWAPANGLRLRGGYNRSVRAPSVYELFQQQGLGLQGSEDICAGPNPSASFDQCARTGVTAAQYGNILENPAGQYNSLDGGNPLLDVEKANTVTAGIVWTPRSVAGLSVTLDYYDIKINNLIEDLAPDDIVKTCAEEGDAALCDLVHRDSLGTLWLTTDAYTVSVNQNIGERRARGLDLGASYPWNLGSAGFINFQLLGSRMFEERLRTPLIDYDCVGFYGNQCGIPDAKWRHRMRAAWNTNFKASFALGWRFVSGTQVDDLSDNADLANPSLAERWALNGSDKIDAASWFDLAVGYKIGDKTRLTAGVNNIFDKEPPLGAGLSDIDFGPGFYGFYDPLGRSLYANLQFEF
jgi:outer membrane receptor protein involved in Fe transport